MSYIDGVIEEHQPEQITPYAEIFIIEPLKKTIRSWAGDCLEGITYSGSYAKGTALDSTSDLDLFISLKSSTENTLSEIFQSLSNVLKSSYSIREQNVSIRVMKWGYDIDVVPAKKNKGNTNTHKLYSNRKNNWIQTNIKKHIDMVKKSNRVKEITALKIWRNNHDLKIPSIMIEIMTINALKGKTIGDVENNFLYMLNYISENIETIRVVDPANSNNIISDSMYKYERENLRKAAKLSIKSEYWNDILW